MSGIRCSRRRCPCGVVHGSTASAAGGGGNRVLQKVPQRWAARTRFWFSRMRPAAGGGRMSLGRLWDHRPLHGGESVIVHDDVHDEFLSAFARAQRLRVGDGLDPDTDMGPSVSAGAAPAVMTCRNRAAEGEAGLWRIAADEQFPRKDSSRADDLRRRDSVDGSRRRRSSTGGR